jgi:hypothetical protein
MNAKKAKAIRKEFLWRDAIYIGAPGKPISLNPSCGRAAYKAAKRNAA